MTSNEIKIRFISSWCDNDQLREIWNRMTPNGDYKWNNITIIPTSDQSIEDYYVIINSPKDSDIVPFEKSIVFYMEPKAHYKPITECDENDPASDNTLYIYGHKNNGRNNLEWHLSKTYSQLMNEKIEKTRVLSAIVSGLKNNTGHKLRHEFLKYLDGYVKGFELYGRDQLPYKSYIKPLPFYAKDEALFPYKYTFAAENTSEPHYFTEKIVDAILSECLCFYWGCPNLSDYIDPRAYIPINLNDPVEAIVQINIAIHDNEWEKRIDVIRKEKKRILNELQFFPTLERIINKIHDTNKTKNINTNNKTDNTNKINNTNNKNKFRPDEILNIAKQARISGDNQKAFDNLMKLFNNRIERYDCIYDFNLWDEMGSVTFYVNRKDLGRLAFNKLIELAESGKTETIEGLRVHGDRIIQNCNFYDDSDLVKKLSVVIEKIKSNSLKIQINKNSDNVTKTQQNAMNKKIIAFHDNQLCERGTTIALYDFAHYNETLLGNKSIIIYNRNHPFNNKNIEDKFHDRFTCFSYNDIKEVDTIVTEQKADAIYWIKYGRIDEAITKVDTCKNLIHSVFDNQPHGNRYAFVSKWMTDAFDKNVPYVPFMINLPVCNENLRKTLDIPDSAIVFGRYGGKETFDLAFVHQVIEQIVKENQNIYFLFANTYKFCNEHHQIIHLDTLTDPIEKVKFINTCDAMLHARELGETFGIAIGEFSTLNKPIVTYAKSYQNAHIDILGEKGIYYNDYNDLYNVLNDFSNLRNKYSDWNCFRDYTPENVMQKFNQVFLSDYKIRLTSTDYDSNYFCSKKISSNLTVENPDYFVAINSIHPNDKDIETSRCILLKTDNNEISESEPFDYLAVKQINNENPLVAIYDLIETRNRRINYVNSILDIYCINLPISTNRWKRSCEQFEKYGLQVNKFEAIDGTTLDLQEMISQNIVTNELDGITRNQKGALGIIASSYKLWNEIVKKNSNKWSLILEDDIIFHPDFLEVFENNWKNIPDDTDIVYFGFNDSDHIDNIYYNIQNDIVKIKKKVSGGFAYAINQKSVLNILQNHIPLSEALDTFSPFIFNLYAFKRPDRKIKNDFYCNLTTSVDSMINLHGIVSVRPEKSTVGHIQHRTLQSAIAEKNNGNYQRAYNYLSFYLQCYSEDIEMLYYFEIWDEMIEVAHHIGKIEDGQKAIKKLIELYNKGIHTTVHGIKTHGQRILENIKFYNCLDLYNQFKKIVNKDNHINNDNKNKSHFIDSKLDIYCINLARSKDRWNSCLEEFEKHNLNVTRFEAIDGTQLDFEDLIKRNIVTRQLDKVSRIQKGALGIIASSYELWTQISQKDSDKWSLILEDDVKFHPDFVELFEKYWNSVPDDADIVLVGFHYPWCCGPYEESVLSNISTNVNDYVVKLHTTVNGNYAYAINRKSSLKLLNHYIPVSIAIDKFPTNKFNIYAFKRPANTSRELIDSIYVDRELWEGKQDVVMFGLAGTRNEKSTISHLKYNYMWFVNHEYNNKNYKESFDYLMKMTEDVSLYDPEISNFTLWYKIIDTAQYVDNNTKQVTRAVEELINRKSLDYVKTNVVTHFDNISLSLLIMNLSDLLYKLKLEFGITKTNNKNYLIEKTRDARIKGDNNTAYKYLSYLLHEYNSDRMNPIYDFQIWDELSSVTFYVNRKDVGRSAFKKMIELVENNNENTIKNLRIHHERIIKNCAFYDCPEIYNTLQNLTLNYKDFDHIIPMGDHDAVVLVLKDLKIRKCAYPFDWCNLYSQLYDTNLNQILDIMKRKLVNGEKDKILMQEMIGNAFNNSERINFSNNLQFKHSDNYFSNSVVSTYTRRFKRLIEHIVSGNKNLYIFVNRYANISEQKIIELRDLLIQYNKNSKLLLFLGKQHDCFKSMENVIYKYIPYDPNEFNDYDTEFRKLISNHIKIFYG